MPIYFLNGLTSAGKSSIVAAMLATRRRAFYTLSYDLFEDTIPPWLADDDRAYAKAIRALYAAARSYAMQGADVVIDGLVMNLPGLERHYETLLALMQGVDLRMIHVRCPMEILRLRNIARGDRREDQSEAQARIAEADVAYWMELDTHALSAEECAAKVLSAMDKG